MSQITGSRNSIHTYEMDVRTDINENTDECKKIINILNANKVNTLFKPTKGFVPYQFERGLIPDLEKDIKNSKIDDILVVKHYEKKLKQRKENPVVLRELLKSENLSDDEKQLLETFLNKTYYNIFYQDFVFIPNGEKVIVIFPSNNRDDTLQYQLNPYFENIFEFNLDSTVRKITQDLLEWLVWKNKRYMNGIVGPSLQIELINVYDSGAYLNNGELKVNIEGIENNVYAMLSMASDERCKGIDLLISFENEKFRFVLFPEGSYIPIWTDIHAQYDENRICNKILILQKISLEIIPYLYKQYMKDKKEWGSKKDDIKKELLDEVSNHIEI